jgi:LmbE family N-acetylglucosaminyl deacetylase
MDRRDFLGQTLAGNAMLSAQGAQQSPAAAETVPGGVVVERAAANKPHAGRVLAAIQPHADDIPIFASGTTAKLIAEGYTGYLIRITNDDMTGAGTIGEGTHANETDNQAVARALGLQKVFDLNYNNHRLDEVSPGELRARMIFLIRLLKIDTVICYDPWGRYEENPDHYVTARAVESACWMAGMSKDYPEHLAAGLAPHSVREKYYYARGPQLVNRVVDITGSVEKKIDSLIANKAQGPAGEAGAHLRTRLAARNLRLPVLGSDDATANREYIRTFLLEDNREWGRRYGVEYAEQFHYIGAPAASAVDEYVRRNAVALR